MPPERITSKSSMQSAPAAIPAMIAVSFPGGFTAADLTREDLITTRSVTSSDKPASSASAITGTRPAHDTRLPSSNNGAARDHPSGSFTISAFWLGLDQELDTPDPSDTEGTSS